MSLIYPKFRQAMALKLVDCSTADWRAVLLMTNSSVLDDTDAEFLGDLATVGEFDGAGYARQALANEVVRLDLPNLRVELDGDDPDFGVLNGGSYPIKGMALIHWTGSDATSRLAVFLDQTLSPGPHFPYSPTGFSVKPKFDPEGFALL